MSETLLEVAKRAAKLALAKGADAASVGAWRAREGDAPAGWYWVPTDQPRGLLAAWLLEPASEDGVVTWNLVNRGLRPRTDAPVRRLRTVPEVAREAMD